MVIEKSVQITQPAHKITLEELEMNPEYCKNNNCEFYLDQMYRGEICRYVEGTNSGFSPYIDYLAECPQITTKDWKCPVCGYSNGPRTFSQRYYSFGTVMYMEKISCGELSFWYCEGYSVVFLSLSRFLEAGRSKENETKSC